MIKKVDIQNEINRIGYFAVIPATVLFNNELKPNEKLLYALITALSNKEGYCYASNKYLGEKLGVDHKTVSRWLGDLRKYNYLVIDIIRNEQQEVIQRKIYPNDIPYLSKNHYPYILNNHQSSDEKVEDNNIKYNNINTHTVSKEKFLDNVYLYNYEYTELVNEYGETIEELSLYKKSKGVEYKSDFATIKRWVILRVAEVEQRQRKQSNNKKKTRANFEQREYPKEFFDSLYDNAPYTNSSEMEDDDMDLDM